MKKAAIAAFLVLNSLQHSNNRFAQWRHVIWRHSCNVYTSGRYGINTELFTQTQNLLFCQATE